MPWAVAWYADRPSVWIPLKYQDFMGMSDYAKLPGTLVGLFMTTPQPQRAVLFEHLQG